MSFNEFIGEREREIKAEVNRLKKENSTLKKQLDIANIEIERQKEYLDISKAELKRLQKENTILKKQIDLNEKEANGLTTLIKHKNKEIKELEKQIPTRERIIEVLDKYRIKEGEHKGYINGDLTLYIASEILGEENNDKTKIK